MEGLAVLFLGLTAIAAAQDSAYRAHYGYSVPPAYAAQAEPAYNYSPPAYVYAPAPPVAPAYAAPAHAQAAPARSAQSTDQYIDRWQGFMEPVGRR